VSDFRGMTRAYSDVESQNEKEAKGKKKLWGALKCRE